MSDIFQEIDDQLRQDRAAALWKRYGGLVIGAAVLVVVAVGGFRYWQYQDVQNRQNESQQYQRALEQLRDGNEAGAVETFGTLASDSTAGYAVLARLQQAAAAAESGDVEGALIAWRAVADDTTVPTPLRDLARLKWAAQSIAAQTDDNVTPALDVLAIAGNPWRPIARELQAVRALQDGDTAAAREIFVELADDATTPTGLRARATEMLRALPDS